MAENTIFDKILKKEIPAAVVFEDDWVLAFKDVTPQAPIHVLVIPKRRLERFADVKQAPATDVGEFFRRVALVAEQLGLEKNGYRIVVNNGKDGGQTVDYLHAHILGGRRMTGL